MTREIALHCMKADSELHSEMCEHCEIYGETGTDHCFADAQEMAIKALEQMSEWIPVNKKLPDKLKDVLVTFVDAPGEYDVAYMRKTFNGVYKGEGAENEWVSSMGETTYADYEISAWMLIPEYKDGE